MKPRYAPLALVCCLLLAGCARQADRPDPAEEFTLAEEGACTLSCGGKGVRLSSREFDVMRCLLQAGERNLAKEAILARVWGYDSEAVENHVEVYVGFLRKKLKSIGSNVRIEAVRRQGYHLEVDGTC